MRGHDAFEALCGAIALGEATPSERARFAAHAERCAACRADAQACGSLDLRELFSHAEAAETWRPLLAAPVTAKIRDVQRGRTRFATVALTWGVCLSIAANVVVACGIPARIGEAWQDRASLAETRATVPVVANAPAAALDERPVARRAAPRPRARLHRNVRARVAPAKTGAVSSVGAPAATSAPVDSLLQGLAIDPAVERAAPHVAALSPVEAATARP